MMHMNEEATVPKKARMTWVQALVAIIALLVLTLLYVPTYTRFSEKAVYMEVISNARQIVMALQLYASDHDGKYPDSFLKNPSSSNEVFRVLFREEFVGTEEIFGCPVSPFVPDGKIGEAPEFKQAVKAGENHWGMTAGLSDKDSGSIPLVYENPAIASWPPKWNADATGKETRGRAGAFGIIIGMNDGGAMMQPLESKTGTAVEPKELGEGKNIFSQHGTDWTILNVEAAPGAK